MLSENIGQCQIQDFYFFRYLIVGGNVLQNFEFITSEINLVITSCLRPSSKCHNVVFRFSHNIFTFTLTFIWSSGPSKMLRLFSAAYVFNFFLLLLSWIWSQLSKKTGLLMWRNLIKFQILLQTILIIWYCGKPWCAKCVVPWWWMQSYPVKRRFSQCRQMSGRRFLDNLREVLPSKKICGVVL